MYIPLGILKVELDRARSAGALQYAKRQLFLHNTLRNNYSNVTLIGGWEVVSVNGVSRISRWTFLLIIISYNDRE